MNQLTRVAMYAMDQKLIDRINRGHSTNHYSFKKNTHKRMGRYKKMTDLNINNLKLLNKSLSNTVPSLIIIMKEMVWYMACSPH